MALQSDGSLAQTFGLVSVVVGFSVFVSHFSVDGDGDFLAFDFDIVSEPFAVFVAGLLEVLEAVNAARLPPVTVGGIDLAFVAVGGPAVVLIFGVDEDPGIGFFGGFHFALEFEVLEFGVTILSVKEVPPLSLNLDCSVLHGKGFRILGIDLPALHGLSVEHVDPLSGKGEGSGGDQDYGK